MKPVLAQQTDLRFDSAQPPSLLSSLESNSAISRKLKGMSRSSLSDGVAASKTGFNSGASFRMCSISSGLNRGT